jgi:hypothetical protein
MAAVLLFLLLLGLLGPAVTWFVLAAIIGIVGQAVYALCDATRRLFD